MKKYQSWDYQSIVVALDAYVAGKTMQQVEVEYNVPIGTLEYWLKKCGIPSRARNGGEKKWEEIMRLLQVKIQERTT